MMLIVSWSIPILASVLSFIIAPASSFVLSFGFLSLPSAKTEAKRPATNVSPNSASIKLGHDLSDLL